MRLPPQPADAWNNDWDDECHETGIQSAIASTQAMMCRSPGIGAGYLRVAEGVVVFQGNAVMTRASGLGWHHEVSVADVESVETFFRQRGSGYSRFSVSSLSHPSLPQVLQKLGYVRSEASQNWWRAGNRPIPEIGSGNVTVLRVPVEQAEPWCRIVAAGFHGGTPAQVTAEFVDVFFALGFADGAQPLLAIVNDEPAGGAVVSVHGRIARLSTASVLPQHRRKGVQQTLIAERLRLASQLGCSVVLARSSMEDESARNLARFQFERRNLTFTMWRDF